MDTSGKSMWIDDTFPNLAKEGYEVTSVPSDVYNCIAYAAGDETTWWSHVAGYRWPNARRTPLIESLVEVFAGLGFEQCDNSDEEESFRKVALYAKGLLWTHAAQQLPGGLWSSKLGPDEDISHPNPEALSGAHYGEVYCIMRGPNSEPS